MSYTWEGMQKISYEEAMTLFQDGEEVFLLYPDETEGACVSIEELRRHYADGEFGVEK